MNRAIWAAFAVALGCVVAFDGGCADDTPAGSGTGGAGNDASVGWSQNACHGCFADRCSAELSACRTDPTCAVFAECVTECPAEANGAPSSRCVQACPGASGASDMLACLSSAQAACTECGGSVADSGAQDGGGCAPELLCQECGPSAETNPCWKCQDERCCDSDQACKDDPGCFSYFKCLQGCSGSRAECVAECDASVGAEHFVKYQRKATCIMTHCLEPTECGNEAVDPCVGCVLEKCPSEHAACETNDACARMSLCFFNCADDSCRNACFSQFSAGRALFNAESDCTLGRCEDLCSER